MHMSHLTALTALERLLKPESKIRKRQSRPPSILRLSSGHARGWGYYSGLPRVIVIGKTDAHSILFFNLLPSSPDKLSWFLRCDSA